MLEIRNLHVAIDGKPILKGIDLNVAAGDFYALLGPNGAGKTTAIGIICSLVNKTAGSVQIFGHDIDTELAQAKACIGLVPQEINMNQFETVLNIVTNQAGYYGIPRRKALERAEQYLGELRLWDRRNEPARNLSGGMKRRLMIARALIHEPRLLILDEPTAGVDIEIRRSMWEFIRDINERGTTEILTTHYLEEAEQLCRNIAIIDHGNIIENTDMRSLLAKLDIETFVLDLRECLEQPPVLEGMEIVMRDEYTLEVSLPRRKSVNALFAELDHRGIHVVSMRNKANRLEELFLRLVDKGQAA